MSWHVRTIARSPAPRLCTSETLYFTITVFSPVGFGDMVPGQRRRGR